MTPQREHDYCLAVPYPDAGLPTSSEELTLEQVGNDVPGISDVVLVTTPQVPGRQILETFGVVCGEAIIGADLFSNMFAGITDIVGGHAGPYENRLQEARDIALAEMARVAKERGANCVIGVDIDYETIRATMLMVVASGTAAKIYTPARGTAS